MGLGELVSSDWSYRQMGKNARNASVSSALQALLEEAFPTLALFSTQVTGVLDPGQQPLQAVTDSHLSPPLQLIFPMGHNTMTSRNSCKNEFKQGSFSWRYCLNRLQEGLRSLAFS